MQEVGGICPDCQFFELGKQWFVKGSEIEAYRFG
jgi:hypothetical protein